MVISNDTPRPPSPETYFFRDQGQIDLLRLCLLPELIERRRGERTLRLWSAGCSSGEEAYTLAMLVDMLLPQRDDWEIRILGSDINPALLTKARGAAYTPWSFRLVASGIQQRYFRRAGDLWMLDERIRAMVEFRAFDLIEAPFPGGELHDLDLIVCRNVFIYFISAQSALVAQKLVACLSDGGYLMTGHAELMGHQLHDTQPRLFPEGLVYRRCHAAPAVGPDRPPLAPARIGTPRPRPATMPRPPAAQRPPKRPADRPPAQGKAAVEPIGNQGPDHLLAAAHACADRGDYAQAEQHCRQAVAMAPLAAEPYFLLAQLAQLRGDFTQARQWLEKTLYLDPDKVAAYLELAALFERTEQLLRARSLRHAALEIVRALPADRVIAPYDTTAAELLEWLKIAVVDAPPERIQSANERI